MECCFDYQCTYFYSPLISTVMYTTSNKDAFLYFMKHFTLEVFEII